MPDFQTEAIKRKKTKWFFAPGHSFQKQVVSYGSLSGTIRGEEKAEFTSGCAGAIHPEPASVKFNQRPGDKEAKPAPFGRRIAPFAGPVKPFEYPFTFAGTDSRTGISNGNQVTILSVPH